MVAIVKNREGNIVKIEKLVELPDENNYYMMESVEGIRHEVLSNM